MTGEEGWALYPEELAAARAYIRPDEEDDSAVIAAVLAARSYLEAAGVALPPAGGKRRALYDLVCHSLALSVYDRRDPIIPGAVVSENPVLRSMLTQLRLTQPEGGEHDADTNS